MRWLKTLRPTLPAAAAWCGLTILPQFLPAAAPTTPLKVRPAQTAPQTPKAKQAEPVPTSESLFPGATVVTDPSAAVLAQDGERPVEGTVASLPGITTISDAKPTAAKPQIDTLRDDSTGDYDLYPKSGVFHFSSGALRVRQPGQAADTPAVQSEQPLQSTAPQQTQATTAEYSSPFGGGLGGLGSLASLSGGGERTSAPPVGQSDFVMGGEQAVVRASNDVGTLIQDSPQATNVSLFRRAMMSEPHIRGYHQRQIYTQLDGGYWMAARWDLDTIVSKIDSGIVEDVIVIKGPYSALYGPTLSVIDVVTARTPRSCCGTDVDLRTVFNYDTNGQGWYGRQAASIGAENWGARISTGIRGASDYEAGDDVPIVGSFKSRDIDAAFGYDLDCDTRVEFKYVRLDMTDAELHNQPTDIGFLVTNGFTGRFEMDYQEYYDHLVLDAWYNRTRVGQSGTSRGGALNDPNFPVPDAIGVFDIAQYADTISTGSRLGLTWGDFDCSHLTVGADFRYINQEILEQSRADLRRPNGDLVVNYFNGRFDLPVSDSYNPGLYTQATDHLTSDAKVTIGGRLDHVSTDPGVNRNPNAQRPNPDDLRDWQRSRDFDLWSAFVSAEYEINCELTATAALGHGQRAPTLTELYVYQTGIAGNQNGTNFYEGNPNLDEERATQVDVGLAADYCNMRGSLRGFYTWVDDYITYVYIPGRVNIIDGYGFTNTNFATLAGFEVNGEYDLTSSLTAFGQVAYVEGRDQETNTPLYGIYPLQSRVGLRLENGDQCQGWGLEFSSRIVDNQDRVAGPGFNVPSNFDRDGNGANDSSRGDLGEFLTPGFTTYDLRGFYRFSEGFLLTGGVENLTDKLYFEHYDYRLGVGDKMGGQNYPSFQRGRNFYIGMEARY